MNSKSGAFSQLWTSDKQDPLDSDRIFVIVVWLLALALAVVVIVLELLLANSAGSPEIAPGAGGSAAHWSPLGQFSAPSYEGSQGAGVALALDPDEAHGHSRAQIGRAQVDPVGAPSSAPGATQGICPDEAHARSLAQTGLARVGPVSGPSGAAGDQILKHLHWTTRTA